MEELIGWAIGMFVALFGGLMLWKQPQEEVVEPILFVPKPPDVPEPPKPEPIVKTNREKLYETAFACLGVDMAPTQDYVGCAEALSFVLKKAGVKGLPSKGILSTAELDKWLSANLQTITSPEFGDIAMFPTGKGNGSVRGHCFVVGKHHWMSNNSHTTLWDDHWTAKEALAYYFKRGGIAPRYYRWP